MNSSFHSIQSIAPLAERFRASGLKLVLATGFFDLLHQEHINFLKKASSQGDVLFVAVESDKRARTLKGEGRPLESQAIRCRNLITNHLADYVIALDDTFNNYAAYESLISAIKPSVYAVSSHTSYQENKKRLVEKYGGQLIIVHPHNPKLSTTQLINTKKQL